MIYFTADLHLGHKNVIKLAERPFSTVAEMDEALVRNWNDRVKGNDTVYILGDLMCKCQDPEAYLRELKGKKVLILGNHDAGWLEKIDKDKYFIKTALMHEQSLCDHMLTLCHYPMLEWRASRKESNCKKLGYLVHGHIHGRCDEAYKELYKLPHALNAGVDVNGFEPVTFDELRERNFLHKQRMLKELGE